MFEEFAQRVFADYVTGPKKKVRNYCFRIIKHIIFDSIKVQSKHKEVYYHKNNE